MLTLKVLQTTKVVSKSRVKLDKTDALPLTGGSFTTIVIVFPGKAPAAFTVASLNRKNAVLEESALGTKEVTSITKTFPIQELIVAIANCVVLFEPFPPENVAVCTELGFCAKFFKTEVIFLIF